MRFAQMCDVFLHVAKQEMFASQAELFEFSAELDGTPYTVYLTRTKVKVFNALKLAKHARQARAKYAESRVPLSARGKSRVNAQLGVVFEMVHGLRPEDFMPVLPSEADIIRGIMSRKFAEDGEFWTI